MAKSDFKTGTRGGTGAPGLFSLSQITHLMRVEFSRAQRYNYPIACVLLAIDRLSELRELYGYDSKEAILDETVRLTIESDRQSARGYDRSTAIIREGRRHLLADESATRLLPDSSLSPQGRGQG